jgi:hypothetical protein
MLLFSLTSLSLNFSQFLLFLRFVSLYHLNSQRFQTLSPSFSRKNGENQGERKDPFSDQSHARGVR